MTTKILINAIDPGECRIAKVKDSKLEEFHIESAAHEITHGNIYKGVIVRVEPGLQAAFVDYGAERHGFLQKHEIHSDYFLDNPKGDQSIRNIVKPGQELLLQVTKDPIMKKGAMMSTFISLPGRYVVLMPGSKNQGISRKIEDDEERGRLRDILAQLNVPEDFGLILRTAGAEASKTSVSKDLRYLMRLWKTIKQKGMNQKAPVLLYKDRNLALRSIRDNLSPEVSEILIDNMEAHQEVRDFVKIISPKQTKIVKLYKGEKPIFSKYQLEDQIAYVFESRVKLKSGGSIVIEQTEAMVSIDVNSGKGSHQKSVEQTALLTNLEAAEEIARQLRIRDMGGLIVIDFIDMRDRKHKLEVERSLKSHVKSDRAKTKIGRISRFGMLEMSRQRIRPSIDFGSFEPCRYCGGKGLTPSPEWLGLGFMRKLSLETLKDGIAGVKCIVPSEVADYLLNRKRREILDLELQRFLSITIIGDNAMIPGESQIILEPQTQETKPD